MQADIWTILALAYLLCQVTGEIHKDNCSTMTITENKRILLGSTYLTDRANLTVKSDKECADLCCQKTSYCNVAEFTFLSMQNNCIHAFCQPSESCLETIQKSNNVSATFMVAAAIQVNQPHTVTISDKHVIARTIKPRKGVELNQSVHLPFSLVANNSETTLENSTMNSRVQNAKNLTWTHPETALTLTMESTVPATDIGIPEVSSVPSLVADKKHSIPRKGAYDGQWDRITTSASNTESSQISTTPVQTMKEFQVSTEMSLTDQTSTGSSNGSINNSTITEQYTSSITIENVTQKPIVKNGFVRPQELEKIDLNQYSNVESGSKTAEKPLHVYNKELVTKGALFNKTSIIMNPTSNQEIETGTVNLVTTTSSTIQDKIFLVMTKEELYLQQSIYLIVSLIIGFLILLLVIGMILKHIHGVWERRHYQRMDFLIDGMYNTV